MRIIANSLTASSNAIVATDSLVKYLANYHEIEDQAPYHYDTNLEVGIKTQRGASGELDLKPTLLFAAGDGENKISSYFSSTLIDGVKYIFSELGELIGGAEKEEVQQIANDNEQELPQAIFRELVSKYGKDTVHAALKDGQQIDGLLNNVGNSYKEANGKLIVTLPQKGLVNARGVASSGLIISLDIITKEEAILLGIHALKVGKYFVRLVPVAGALLLAYEVGSYLADHPELTSGKFLEATEFAKDVVDKAKDAVKAKLHETGAESASGGPDDDGDDDWQKNPNKAESPAWKELKPYKGKTKTNGLSGKDRRYYEWDHLHNDIEVFDHKGEHLGSMDPVKGNMYKNTKGHKPSFK